MFSNIDRNAPQKVHITWTMETPHDDSADRPDDRDEGFWPSLDQNAAGWIGSTDLEEFERQMAAAEERMNAWERGDWHFIGVVARADILIPIGGNSFRMMTLRSAGLWGIESDAGDYLDHVFEEEKASLLDELKTLYAGLSSDDLIAA